MRIATSCELGGAGASFASAIVAIEELARVDPSVSAFCNIHNVLVINTFRKYGTKQQRHMWLPGLATEKLGSFCLSESASGSDAFALQTRAVKEGDHWIVNGSKTYVFTPHFGFPLIPWLQVDHEQLRGGCFPHFCEYGL